jgi:hypothetical protein
VLKYKLSLTPFIDRSVWVGAADVDLDLAALVEESVPREAVETETDLAVASFIAAAAAASLETAGGR